MKRYKALVLLSAVSVVSCQEEIEQNIGEKGNAIPMSFYAGIEIPKDSISTRTILGGAPSDSYRSVLWEYQDEVYVTNGTTSSKFVNTTEGTSDVALLEGELPQAADYYAAYPFDIVKGYSASGFKMELPSVQTYYPDGVSSGSFPMVAQCDDGIFSFRNLCGIFVLRLTGDETISSVTFSGKDASGKDIPVAGNGTVSMDHSENPTLLMDDSAVTSVTLKSSEGVRLNPSQPTAFHVVLPSGTYNTFTIIIKATDGTIMTVESIKALEIKRSNRTSAAVLTYSGVIHYQDLNESGGTANSYIISSSGGYKFKAVKGNSSESVGSVSSVEVLWESFGTDAIPEIGDLVREVSHSDGYIQFSTPPVFKEGNAVIAAKDASGTILWSWHIWLTDAPEEQIYYNNAGTMMDRNLGATSSTPGDVGSLGLLYQWGRKDPFLGSSSINENSVAESTYSWPSAVNRKTSIEYAIKNPTTYIYSDANYNNDWYYVSRGSVDTTRWQSKKTIYDPCPIGWRVPDGGENAVWRKGYNKPISLENQFDSINKGVDFSGLLGDSDTIWYPATGYRAYDTGNLYRVGNSAFYDTLNFKNVDGWGIWSLEIHSSYSPGFTLQDYDSAAAGGGPIRCLKEVSSSGTPSDPVAPNYEDLSASGTANSYIISTTGDYEFEAVKGNSSESVGSVSSVEVLWESFGTSVTPSVGSLVTNVSYKDGYIQFSTPATFKEGNAVVAAKNSSGEILWSWHIWLTDQPEEQVYYNNAGTMMDRNLGATSSAPGDVGALGLLYQWGRKDPFLGSSNISSSVEAKSTGSWPSTASSSSSTGTIEYATKNPMTFITYNEYNYDWYYTGDYSTDNTRWKSSKTIYDPCPPGWRVPDGGSNGVWAKAGFNDHAYDDANEGMLFGSGYSSPSAWYPASGCRDRRSGGSLFSVGYSGFCWSVTPIDEGACGLGFDGSGDVGPSSRYRAYGQLVRCLKEGSSSEIPSDPVMPTYEDLSVSGTANSYIVNEAGDYRFEAVKGNSSESVGEVSSVEVLWESFGTDVTPEVGDLVREVSHSDGYIKFSTPATFREGNAVIAAKDASGTILWSWHIWLTDAPEEQIYYNNAGTTMDRNLGATSATPGDVGALGLLYQWGRKDPFLGSSSISANEVAKSTATWPSLVKSSLSTGTIEYATENPMTFISENTSNYDWFYPSSSYNESYRWDKAKTRYDPCPNGWRIPNNGLWIMNSITNYIYHPFDNSNKGMDFSKVFGDATSIWYPAAGTKGKTGDLGGYGTSGNYWSVVGSGGNSAPSPYTLMIDDGDLSSATLVLSYYGKTSGHSVRCIKE